MSNAVNSSKLKNHEHITLKVNDPKKAPKTYHKILKTFANRTKNPLTPLLLVRNQLVTANLFDNYFCQQCTTIDNDSFIPPNITFETEQKLFTFEFYTQVLANQILSVVH